MAYGPASARNAIQLLGADANGNLGIVFFDITAPSLTTPGTSAASITVAIKDPAPPALPVTYVPLGPSDGSNLLRLVNVQDQGCVWLIRGGVLTVSTPTSPPRFFSDFTTALGVLVSQTNTLNAAQQTSL